KSAGSGNACSWLDANRRSAHRVGSPGWVEPRRGAACSPAQSSGVTVTPSWFATGDGTEPAGVRDPAREREPSRREREESEREQERASERERKREGGTWDGRRHDHPEVRDGARRYSHGPAGRAPPPTPARAPVPGRPPQGPARPTRPHLGARGRCRARGLTPRSPRAPPGHVPICRATGRLAVVDRGALRAGP